MEISIIIGFIAGGLGIFGLTYQLIKNSIGMTYPMLLTIGISIALWSGYGFSIENPVVAIPNLIMLVLLGAMATKKFLEDENL